MKHKFISIFIALVLALSLCLVTAAPVAAGEVATLLSSTGAIGTSNADTITVEVPAGTTLGDIDSIAWSVYLIQGYPPHVDIMLDGVAGAQLDGTADEALVFEYANNDPLGTDPPTYGALTDAWYQTFSDGEPSQGPAIIDGAASAWLATGLPGGPPAAIPIDHAAATNKQEFVIGTLAQWQAGQVVNEIDADTIVLRLEIETDNYITDCVALVDNIELVIAGGLVEMTASSPGEIIGVSVTPTSVQFGSIVPGTDSDAETVTVTNTGNMTQDFTAEIFFESVPDFYTVNLTIDTAGPVSVAAWGETGIPPADDPTPAGFVEPSLVLSMPRGTPAGDYTATLVFWAIATP